MATPDRVIEAGAGAVRYPVVVCDEPSRAILAHLADRFPKHACCVISDDVVAPLHARRVADALAADDRHARLLTFPAGEASKSREVWGLLTDALIDARFGRDTVVVAVGGGVTGDLAGFVAATYMRGVPVVHVPTSLVAMVDAAIGGKTGIDVAAGKNLVGAFHAPSAVIVAPGTLRTLPSERLREGLVEALKHGAILDGDYCDWILAHARALARGVGADAAHARALVERSIELKVAVVSEDPLEQGRRAILNFGHTVGHGIERATGYGASHGQAVAHGMIVEARIGEALGATAAGTSARLEQAVAALELPPLPRFDAQAVLDSAASDKKNREGALRMVLIRHIGAVARADDGAWTHAVPLDVMRAALGSVV
ncbi:MAG TPA: 3-dehydroquinate synthase [Longimicrobiales bacterium]|nr:3-dehydroquinate synthase [Longimicrobiales bacterium]